MKKRNSEHTSTAIEKINEKRAELINETSKFGMNSPQVLKASEELDTMIINYMRESKKT